MASLEKRTKGGYRFVFRYAGRKFGRTLGTKNHHAAAAARARVEDNLHRVRIGTLVIPADADPAAFLLSGGAQNEKPKSPSVLTIKDLCELYIDNIPQRAIEIGTRKMIQIHVRHVLRLLDGKRKLRSVTQADVQQYVNERSGELGRRGRPISAITIRKEVGTLTSIWKWAVRQGLTAGPRPNDGIKRSATTAKKNVHLRLGRKDGAIWAKAGIVSTLVI